MSVRRDRDRIFGTDKVGGQLPEHDIRQLTFETAERFFVGLPLVP
jgi:hypothetical protein